MHFLATKNRAIACSSRGWSATQLYLAFWIFTFLLFAGSGDGLAQSEVPSEYQVKAAFLYNFGKFVEWPDNVFADPRAPFVIGVFGSDPFQGDLDRIVAGKSINGHSVVVRLVTSVDGLKGCNIVFVSLAQEKKAAEISAALAGTKVLTVTENMKHFAESGFMINFVVEDEHIGFQINNAAATRAGLAVSSKLLSLARPLD